MRGDLELEWGLGLRRRRAVAEVTRVRTQADRGVRQRCRGVGAVCRAARGERASGS